MFIVLSVASLTLFLRILMAFSSSMSTALARNSSKSRLGEWLVLLHASTKRSVKSACLLFRISSAMAMMVSAWRVWSIDLRTSGTEICTVMLMSWPFSFNNESQERHPNVRRIKSSVVILFFCIFFRFLWAFCFSSCKYSHFGGMCHPYHRRDKSCLVSYLISSPSPLKGQSPCPSPIRKRSLSCRWETSYIV